ncbi:MULTISPECIES: hypothetical protein [Nocardiaceae]|uniref:Uncharacterized protein n=1 Tax=Rhodococcoides corynebacterioides TaxID=53972 RepID=A0ABS2KTQ4_9NOCA|nr:MULTISPECIES: hypothetical protein [Rhodococcus]MBM7415242.1 hypothetical protein [Rhodococcus corynebacterioides]MBP1117704.1 hypothetical protein [Rhodococcus sp. PvP016]
MTEPNGDSPVSDRPSTSSERPYDSSRDPDADPSELDDAAGTQPDQAEG